ncbi:hypothetical protein GCM10017667_62570 [Streptomyces filamentosus]|uniref:Uncharacterized protein n=1 Tax=Streptomyces filamentosus TaxID=67294 RepID=A0A919BVK8_STRFL|nr:hypothetical protein GCM10017667_62570 [Streptomyces filamentosus]
MSRWVQGLTIPNNSIPRGAVRERCRPVLPGGRVPGAGGRPRGIVASAPVHPYAPGVTLADRLSYFQLHGPHSGPAYPKFPDEMPETGPHVLHQYRHESPARRLSTWRAIRIMDDDRDMRNHK